MLNRASVLATAGVVASSIAIAAATIMGAAVLTAPSMIGSARAAGQPPPQPCTPGGLPPHGCPPSDALKKKGPKPPSGISGANSLRLRRP